MLEGNLEREMRAGEKAGGEGGGSGGDDSMKAGTTTSSRVLQTSSIVDREKKDYSSSIW